MGAYVVRQVTAYGQGLPYFPVFRATLSGPEPQTSIRRTRSMTAPVGKGNDSPAIDSTRALDALRGLRHVFFELPAGEGEGDANPQALRLATTHLKELEAATTGAPGIRELTEVLRGWATIIFSDRPYTALGGPAHVRPRLMQTLSALTALCQQPEPPLSGEQRRKDRPSPFLPDR